MFLIFAVFAGLFGLVPAPPAGGVSKTAYNESEAHFMSELSAGAYATSPQGCINTIYGNQASNILILGTADLGCDILGDSCASYVAVNPMEPRIYVVFRGTKTDQQLLLEGWVSIHHGEDFYGLGDANKYFSSALETLWPNVEPVLTNPQYSNYPVTFTGHSLGAALASLAALKTVYMNLRPSNAIRLVNFGQPRVGNHQLAMSHDKMVPYSFRVVHADDIVPHLPKCAKDKTTNMVNPNSPDSYPCDPNNTEEGYHHGIEIWYPTHMYPNSTYYECLGQPTDEDFGCSDMLAFQYKHYANYIYAHRYYFEVRIPDFGKTNCVPGSSIDTSTSIEDGVEYQSPSIGGGMKPVNPALYGSRR
uniref:Lipase_3 domain-containing protein n=1 Tax=Panagrellus redivivus TaxID=6233 RepID=A0A7E4VUE2_PANRE